MSGRVDALGEKGCKMQSPVQTYRDITLSISPRSVVFPGDPTVVIEPFSNVAEHGCRTSEMRFSLHTGTHLDAPLHVLEGAASVDEIALDVYLWVQHRFLI